MFSSKVCYMLAGFDLALALLFAMVHNPYAFLSLGIAFYFTYQGDKRSQPKGDK